MLVRGLQPTIFSKLNITAISEGYGLAMRVWTILRNAKPHGVCWFTPDEIDALLKGYGFSRREKYRLPSYPGSKLFYQYSDNGLLWLNGLECLCEALDTIPGRTYYIQDADLTRMSRFRSACYAVYFNKERTVSRRTLARETGIKRDTQRKYEAQKGIQKRYNKIACSWEIEDVRLPEGAEIWHIDDDGESSFMWQAPNTYQSYRVSLARPGMARKIGKKLRRHPLCGDGVGRRRFLYGPSCKAKNLRGDIAVALGRTVQGADLYRYCRIEEAEIKEVDTLLRASTSSPVSPPGGV
jgi:hypothetical protein